MLMVAPVPMRVAVVAPRVVSPVRVAVRSVITPRIVAAIRVAVMPVMVVSPVDHDRCGRNDDGRRDTEADINVDTGLSGLRLRQQYESQKWDHTIHAYDMCEIFHHYILTVEHQLCSMSYRAIRGMLPHICC
jgi:hypothetical protein